MRYLFHSEQWLPQPIERIFAFFANPENLPRIMPKSQGVRIEEASFAPPPPRPNVPGVSPRLGGVIAGPGTHITLGYRPFPYAFFRLPWELEVTEFEWNSHFSDLQLRGPFAYWNQIHSFEAQTRTPESGILTPGTLIRDDIEYELPFGKLGELAQRLIVARQLRSLFAHRRDRLRELFGGFATR